MTGSPALNTMNAPKWAAVVSDTVWKRWGVSPSGTLEAEYVRGPLIVWAKPGSGEEDAPKIEAPKPDALALRRQHGPAVGEGGPGGTLEGAGFDTVEDPQGESTGRLYRLRERLYALFPFKLAHGLQVVHAGYEKTPGAAGPKA